MLLKKFKIIPVFLLLFATMEGCKKMDLVPADRFTELNFWESDANVNNALNNVYNHMYNSQLFFDREALSDNAVNRAGVGAGAITSGNFTPTLSNFASDWDYFFTGIKAANVF